MKSFSKVRVLEGNKIADYRLKDCRLQIKRLQIDASVLSLGGLCGSFASLREKIADWKIANFRLVDKK